MQGGTLLRFAAADHKLLPLEMRPTEDTKSQQPTVTERPGPHLPFLLPCALCCIQKTGSRSQPISPLLLLSLPKLQKTELQI
jgi:hypothetical protein